MPYGQRNKRHTIKPLVHIGIVLLIAIAIVCAYHLHFINSATPVPSSVDWFIEHVISTSSVMVVALVLLLIALLHKKYKNIFSVRRKLRGTFFFVLTFLTGKFYTWSGLLLAMWVLSTYTNIAQRSPLYIFFSVACLVVGYLIWIGARTIAFQGIHRLPDRVNQAL